MTLLLLLAAWLLTRASYDPFRPPPPTFPRARLLRAGLDEEAVDRLADRYDHEYPPGRKARFARDIASLPDGVIRDRFTLDADDDLDAMKVPELRRILEARGQPLGGTKAELIARLTDARTAADTARADAVRRRAEEADAARAAEEEAARAAAVTPEQPQEPAETPPGPDTQAGTPEADSGSDSPQTAAPAPTDTPTADGQPPADAPAPIPAPDAASPADGTPAPTPEASAPPAEAPGEASQPSDGPAAEPAPDTTPTPDATPAPAPPKEARRG